VEASAEAVDAKDLAEGLHVVLEANVCALAVDIGSLIN
jgi:hypothetical protein